MCKSHLLGSFSCLQNCLCSFAISLCKRIGHHLYLFFSFRVKALLSILCWERFATTSLSSRKNSYKWRYISSDEIKTWFRRLLWVFCLHFRWTWVTENSQQSTKPSFNLVSAGRFLSSGWGYHGGQRLGFCLLFHCLGSWNFRAVGQDCAK